MITKPQARGGVCQKNKVPMLKSNEVYIVGGGIKRQRDWYNREYNLGANETNDLKSLVRKWKSSAFSALIVYKQTKDIQWMTTVAPCFGYSNAV